MDSAVVEMKAVVLGCLLGLAGALQSNVTLVSPLESKISGGAVVTVCLIHTERCVTASLLCREVRLTLALDFLTGWNQLQAMV